jgi:hypothetical protein
MTNLPLLLKNRSFALSVTSVLLLGVAVGVLIGTSDKVPDSVAAQDALPLITSASSAIRVVGLQRTNIGDNPVLKVSLQNISPKNISAYSIGSGKAWITRSYYFAERAFLPNAIETQIIPLNTKGFNAQTRDFTVIGVLFEDGATDGQAIPVFRLRENWAGFRDHARILLPCLRQIPATLTTQHAAELSLCESEAAKRSSSDRSSDYQDGFQLAQREFLSQVSEIKNKVNSGDVSGSAKQRDQVIKSFETVQDR